MRIYRNFIIKFILSIIGNLYNQLQLFFHTKIFFLLKKKFIKDYYRNTLYSKNFNSEVILNKLYPPKIFIFRNLLPSAAV